MAAIAEGSAGVVRTVFGARVGSLTEWEIVISPTTGKPTLKGRGTFLHYWSAAGLTEVVATLTTDPPPNRPGRPKSKPRTVKLRGTVARLIPTAITIAQGELIQ